MFFFLKNPFWAAPAAGAGDPNFANVELLVVNETGKADGNTSFTDQSSNGFTVTPNGGAQWDTGIAPPSPMDASLLCGDGISLTVADNAALEPGSGDFTLEMFVYCTFAAQGRAFTKGTYSGGMVDIGVITDSGAIYLELSSDGVSADIFGDFIAGVSAIPNNSWVYVGISRSGTSITTAYKTTPVAGQSTTSGGSDTSSSAINNSGTGITIGNDNNNAFHTGNLFGVRYTVGVARSIATVPTFAFPTS